MTPLSDPGAEYAQRLSARRASLEQQQRRHHRIGNTRLLVFATAALLAWLSIFQHAFSVWWLLAPLAGFIALVAAHQKVLERIRLAHRAIHFYERGIDRLEDRWQGKGEPGERFSVPSHCYAEDLDLFGKGSLFELLCAARTRAGEATLAKWILTAADASEIQARQEAIDELRPMLDLREDLAVLGEDFRAGVHPEELAAWGGGAPIEFPRGSHIIARVLAIVTFAILIGFTATEFIDARFRLGLIAAGLLECAFALPLRKRVLQVIAAVEHPGHDLALLAQVLRRLEAEQFTSPRLAELRAAVEIAGHPASERIRRLNRLIEYVDSRDNFFVRLFGPLVLWTTQLAMALGRWRRTSGPAVEGWLRAVGEMEALSSLAGYAYEHRADPFPALVESGPLFDGEALGHPLLPEARCVRNDVRLSPDLRLLVVSGSNMSGKSTLLRTVGVNAVLAMAGAPVRAKRLTISPLSVGASIRVMDSLQGGSSRFYAEITRIREIMELPRPVLFLLDELLHGTNSHDRLIGAQAIVRNMIARGAIGLITTHDLALAHIAESLGPQAANVHFEDHLEDGRITFDYRMRPGVVEKSNALELMRAVGIEV
jgi:hypothetical protein